MAAGSRAALTCSPTQSSTHHKQQLTAINNNKNNAEFRHYDKV